MPSTRVRIKVRVQIDRAALASEFQVIGHRWMRRVLPKVRRRSQAKSPVVTGRLKRSIAIESLKVPSRFRVSGEVSANTPYARFVHDGTRAHVIRPRRANALRFQVGGRTVFAAKVNHPGTRANPFLRRAVEEVVAEETR